MSFIDNMLDWAADKVQIFTREKERKELVQKSKDKYMEFKEIVENYINFINEKILDLNQLIQKINNYRFNQVKKISTIYRFFWENLGV